MDIIHVYGLPVIITLGALSAITGLSIFLTCRCFPIWKPGSKLMNNELFKRFYKAHCTIWWLFWIFVVLHAVVVYFYLFT